MLITLVIFSAVVLGLAGLSFQIGRRTTRATDQAFQMARQISGVDRATVVPFDSITALLKADTVMSGTVRLITTYAITSVSANRKDIRVITRTSVPGSIPDTILIQRASASPIPLK